MRANFKFFTLLSYRKLVIFLPLCFVFLSHPLFAEPVLTKSEFLRKSNQCSKDFQNKICIDLILETEKMQLIESEQNRYKCQSSILGLQTELIEAYFFKKLKKNKKGIMIPYVIKNC